MFSCHRYKCYHNRKPRPDYEKLRHQLNSEVDILPYKQEKSLEHNMKNYLVMLPQEILDLIDSPQNLSVGERIALRRTSRVLFIGLAVFLPKTRPSPYEDKRALLLTQSELSEVYLALNADLEGNIRSLDCRGIIQEKNMAYCGDCKTLHPTALFTDEQLLLLPLDRRCRRLRLCPHRDVSHQDFLRLQNPKFGLMTSTWCTAHQQQTGNPETEREAVNTSTLALRGVQGSPPFHPAVPSYQQFECMRLDVPTIHSSRGNKYMPASTCSLFRKHSLLLTNNEELQSCKLDELMEETTANLAEFMSSNYVCEHMAAWPKAKMTKYIQKLLDGAKTIVSGKKETETPISDEIITTAMCNVREKYMRVVKEPVKWVKKDYDRYHIDQPALCRCVLEFTLRRKGSLIELYTVMTRLFIVPEKSADDLWIKEVNRR
jgi:hypothetical protein